MAASSSSSKLLTLRSPVLEAIIRRNLLRDASPATATLLQANSLIPNFPDSPPIHGIPLENNAIGELFWSKAMTLQGNVIHAAQIEARRTYVPKHDESEDWDNDEESDEDPPYNTLHDDDDDDKDDDWDEIDSDEGDLSDEPLPPPRKRK